MTTTTQKIPSGYKQTEIGVIPTDWDVKKLGELADYKNGKSFESRITDSGNYFLITLNSLDIKGKLKSDHLKVGVNDGSLGKGDLVMILSDVAHGYFLGLTDVILEDNKYVLNQRVGALKNIRHLTPYYLSKYINLKQKYFKTAGQGSSQQNLSKDDILNFCIAYPNSKTEQSAIATAISDVEVLIEKLERLIEKKQNTKQGVMQELFTGKRRLAGFSGKWEVKKLGELLDYEQPTKYLVKDTEYRDNFNTPVLTAGKTFILGYTNEDTGIFKDLPVIIFDDFTTATKFVDFPFKAKSSAMKMLKPRNKDINLRFVFEKMQLIDFKLGDHKRYWISEYQNIEIDTPKPDEQKAIANVLSDMDTEIEKLESQLTKYQNIKQGMMQTLLTGKIRLLTK